MAEAARARGYAYLAVTDHSASHGFGNDVTPKQLEQRIEEVRELDSSLSRFKLLAGSEVNIGTDGSLDYSDELLEELDWVVASVHTSFRIGERNPNRRDLSERYARLAAEAGVTIVINTDAHGVDTMGNIVYGVATARRAWLSAAQVANTRGWREFKKLMKD